VKSVAAAVLLAVLAAAPARASQVEMRCDYSVPDHSASLDEPALGGKVVRGALQSYCRPADPNPAAEVATPELRYFSPVRLLPSGLCKARVYEEHRWATDKVARRLSERGHCPPQHFERYVDTTGISDAEFLALMRFWRDLPTASLDEDAIARRAGSPEDVERMRALFKKVPLRTWLDGRRPLTAISGDDPGARRYLLPEERDARVYVLDDAFAIELTVAAVRGGFEVISIDDQVP
jgi:hypothetical protein